MSQFIPQSIVLEESVADAPMTRRVLERLPGTPVITTPSLESSDLPESLKPANLTKGRRVLLIRRQRGSFLKSCPGCTKTLHCNYHVLHQAENCHLECSYCFLHGWLNNYTMTLYANSGDLFRELDAFSAAYPDRRWRLGTGEYTDSLVFDHLTDQSIEFVEYARHNSRFVLELKTKTTAVDRLLTIPPAENAVIAWSVNPPEVVDREEVKCPTLDERLDAARRCAEHGYPVGFHFDPILYFEGWEDLYLAVVDRIFTLIPPDRVRWISLGTFRYPPSWRSAIAERFPRTRIVYGEHVRCDDGKYRYLKAIRMAVYQKMYARIRMHARRPWVYLCMEPRELWDRVFGWSPKDDREMERCYTEGFLPPI